MKKKTMGNPTTYCITEGQKDRIAYILSCCICVYIYETQRLHNNYALLCIHRFLKVTNGLCTRAARLLPQ